MSDFPDAHHQTPISDRLNMSHAAYEAILELVTQARKQHMHAGPILERLEFIIKTWSTHAPRRAVGDLPSGASTGAAAPADSGD